MTENVFLRPGKCNTRGELTSCNLSLQFDHIKLL